VKAAVAEVDAALLRLMDGLKARGLDGKVNLVIVADHGMAEVKPGQTVIADAEAPGAVKMVTGGQSAGFDLLPGREAEGLALLLKPNPNMTCWPKAKIPARLHYGRNPRAPQVVCMARVGWYVTNAESAAKRKPETRVTGSHGYDNAAPEMRALFMAWGPSIRSGAKVGEMDNVDVYPLLATLIGVKPLKNDGKLPKGVLR
jgi:predicted AlkP superfamily pyrophosphatase or phosphodiesterase